MSLASMFDDVRASPAPSMSNRRGRKRILGSSADSLSYSRSRRKVNPSRRIDVKKPPRLYQIRIPGIPVSSKWTPVVSLIESNAGEQSFFVRAEPPIMFDGVVETDGNNVVLPISR